MDKAALDRWFEELRRTLEEAYLGGVEPWQQSGFSGPRERWEALRRPVAECIDCSGAFLDIGCANGYLLECLRDWTAERGLRPDLYGLDFSSRLVELALRRRPDLAGRLFVGNAQDWTPPFRFDFVRTETVYVPDERVWDYLKRLREVYLKPGGRLLVCQYRSSSRPNPPFLNEPLTSMGFRIRAQKSGFYQELELTRVLVIGRED